MHQTLILFITKYCTVVLIHVPVGMLEFLGESERPDHMEWNNHAKEALFPRGSLLMSTIVCC